VLEDLSEFILKQAWEHVRDNAGGPGVDGITISAFAQSEGPSLPEMRQQMLTGSFVALPLRKMLLRKRAGSMATRTLLVPTVRDRIAETAVARLFARSWEEEFVESSYAYRPGRGVDSAVARILQLRDRGYLYVVDADIVAYFDNIPHGGLLKLLREATGNDAALHALMTQWVRATVWDGTDLTPLRRGIPQGSPLSPLLANFYLTPLDLALSQGDQRMVRYADDFLVLCRTSEAAAEALAIVKKTLLQLGLSLHPEKTRLTSFAEGFRFLGVRFGEAEPLIPWKRKDHSSRVMFVARPMPQRLLRDWRAKQAAYRKPKPDSTDPPPGKQPKRLALTTQSELIGQEDEMAYLYITQPGGTLRKSGDRFLLEADGSIVLDLPYHRLEHILVFGNIQVTSQAMAEALDHGIALSIFSRQGRYRGTLQPPVGKNVLLRMEQYHLYADETGALAAAKACVAAKLANSALVLDRYRQRRVLPEEQQRNFEDGNKWRPPPSVPTKPPIWPNSSVTKAPEPRVTSGPSCSFNAQSSFGPAATSIRPPIR
jgi:CRISP-associated protein Cas1